LFLEFLVSYILYTLYPITNKNISRQPSCAQGRGITIQLFDSVGRQMSVADCFLTKTGCCRLPFLSGIEMIKY